MKKNTNIYSNVKFNSEPYSTNDKFCVFTPLDEE